MNLAKLFKKTSFAPHELFKGTGLYYNTVKCEFTDWSESAYPDNHMFYILNGPDGKQDHASVPFADWGSRKDAEFIQAVIEWYQKNYNLQYN